MNIPKNEVFEDRHHNSNWAKKNYPEFHNWITSKYPDISFAGAIYLWIHNIDSIPTCPICGNPVKYKNRSGFYKYCSRECMRKDPEYLANQKRDISPFSNPEIREKAKQTFRERYGVDHISQSKEFQDKVKQTCLEKYGVDNVFKLKEIQDKCHESFKKTITERKRKQYEELEFIVPDLDKRKGTRTMSEAGIKKHYPKFYDHINTIFPADMVWHEKIWRYRNNDFEEKRCANCGKPLSFDKLNKTFPKYCSLKCSNSDPAKKNRTKQTCLKKYGTENPSSTPEVRQKVIDTCKEKYGVEYISQSPKIREKIKKTNLEKYGVEYSAQSPEIQEKIKKTNIERYGVGCYLQLPDAKGFCGSESTPNKKLAKFLDDRHISYEREFYIKDRSYDFKIGNTLIEINPSITHNSTWNPWNKPKSKEYHKEKSELATSSGYECICIWDWDDYDKIINHIISPKQHIGARECIIKEVPHKNAIEFLDNHHLQGRVKGILVTVGLYYNDELVSIMSFGKPRYNKNYHWELLRYCTHIGYTVSGGAQKIMSYFKEKYNPGSIISYCDLSKFSGKIYEKLGFNKNSINISGHWYDLKTHKHITDNLLRQLGFDKIFGTNYGKGTSNEKLMEDHGFVKVWDCGQASFVWKVRPVQISR